MKSKIKISAFIVFALIGILTISFFSFAKDSSDVVLEDRLVDDADLFTPEEEATLLANIRLAIDATHMDMVIVTTNDTDGKSSQDYADDFFDYGGYGLGSKHSGLLYLIDMENRNIWLSTSGDMILFLTDSRIDEILDDQYGFVSLGKYAQSADDVIQMTRKYYSKGIENGQYIYDSDTGRIIRYKTIKWYEALLAIIIPFVVAYGYCVTVVNEYKMKKQKQKLGSLNMAYKVGTGFSFANVADDLIESNVSRRIIPVATSSSSGSRSSSHSSSGRSTTHHSSSGRSHGGGGRHF